MLLRDAIDIDAGPQAVFAFFDSMDPTRDGGRLNRREFDAVREHMRIEGLNLKRFVEGNRAGDRELAPLPGLP